MIEIVAGAVAVIVIIVVALVVLSRRKKSSENTIGDMPVGEDTNAESEPTNSMPAAEESSIQESKPVDPEPVSEDPKAFIKPCDPAVIAASKATVKEEQEINRDFMSKLVASKDASEKAAEVPYWVPPQAPADAKACPAPEQSETPCSETVAEEVPVQDPETSVSVPVEEASSESIGAGDSAVDLESDTGEDIYTDYSPEALVRRAAWNKGLRCRRHYGDHSIQVAFVKPKVAVYVLDPSEAIADEDQVISEGWTVMRFNVNDVTDGLSEGDAIAEAVKANLHAQKTSKKKSSKK